MDNQSSQIALQHKALESLIEDTYGLNIKSFLTDVAELVEQRSSNERLIENLWECALMIPNDPSRAK